MSGISDRFPDVHGGGFAWTTLSSALNLANPGKTGHNTNRNPSNN